MKRAREAKAQFMSEDEIESALNEAMDQENLQESASKLEELNKKVFETQSYKVDIL